MGEVRRAFNPEFLNRLDEVILFNSLTDDDLSRIIDLLVGQINETLVHRQVQIVMTPEARQWILDKTCGDRKIMARRPLRRALREIRRRPTFGSSHLGAVCNDRRRWKFFSAATAFCSVPWWKQPRWPTRNPTRVPDAEPSGGGARTFWAWNSGLDRGRERENFSARILKSFVGVSLNSPRRRAIPFCSTGGALAKGQQFVIERIEFVGNRRVPRDTLLARIMLLLAAGRSVLRRSGAPRFSSPVEHAVF